jgi:hypothetical protein
MNNDNLPSIQFKNDVSNFRLNSWGDTQEDVFSKEGLDYSLRSDLIIVY